jgi:hypothetical protein
MKTLKFYLFLTVSTIIFSQPMMAATYVINPNAGTEQSVTKSKSNQEAAKELKKQFKQEKRMAKMEKIMSKLGIDFSDPVQKWLWFAIIAWAAAIVLYIVSAILSVGGVFSPLWYVGYLAGLAGTVCFVIWIVKLLGA